MSLRAEIAAEVAAAFVDLGDLVEDVKLVTVTTGAYSPASGEPAVTVAWVTVGMVIADARDLERQFPGWVKDGETGIKLGLVQAADLAEAPSTADRVVRGDASAVLPGSAGGTAHGHTHAASGTHAGMLDGLDEVLEVAHIGLDPAGAVYVLKLRPAT
jgi:hypothetical protein